MNLNKPGTTLLRIGQLADRLRLSVEWLKDEAEAGRIPYLKAGKVLLFDENEVKRLLVKRASEGGQAGDS